MDSWMGWPAHTILWLRPNLHAFLPPSQTIAWSSLLARCELQSKPTWELQRVHLPRVHITAELLLISYIEVNGKEEKQEHWPLQTTLRITDDLMQQVHRIFFGRHKLRTGEKQSCTANGHLKGTVIRWQCNYKKTNKRKMRTCNFNKYAF